MQTRCPHCGVKSEAGSSKCRFCGAWLDVQGGNAERQSPPQTQLPNDAGWQASPPTQLPNNAGWQCQPQNPNCRNDTAAPQEPELYNPTADSPALGWLCLIYAPIFAIWCVWQNAKSLGDKKMEQTAFGVTIALIVIILVSPFAVFAILALDSLLFTPLLFMLLAGVCIGIELAWLITVYKHFKYLKENNIQYRKKPWAGPMLGAFLLQNAYAVIGGAIIAAGLISL